jgi:hypothetical protein
VVTLGLGLFAGYLAGARARGAGAAGSLVQVQAPADARLSLDGVRQAGPGPYRLSVTPGREHRIRVEAEGFSPLDLPLTLAPGEVRAVVVEGRPLERASK